VNCSPRSRPQRWIRSWPRRALAAKRCCGGAGQNRATKAEAELKVTEAQFAACGRSRVARSQHCSPHPAAGQSTITQEEYDIYQKKSTFRGADLTAAEADVVRRAHEPADASRSLPPAKAMRRVGTERRSVAGVAGFQADRSRRSTGRRHAPARRGRLLVTAEGPSLRRQDMSRVACRPRCHRHTHRDHPQVLPRRSACRNPRAGRRRHGHSDCRFGDSASRTMACRVELDNAAGIHPGSYARSR